MDRNRGLSTAEVERRRRRDGPNELPAPRGPRPLALLAGQLTHLLAVLLWVAAGLALLARMPALAIAIVVIVVLNALFAFWQEYRADRSTQQLRSMLPSGTRVRRDGARRRVAVSELVVGDVVLLEAGDRVGADMTVVEVDNLTVDESLTTGESGAVRHGVGDLLMAGTFVVQGMAEAEVTATGASTTLARISALTATAQRPPSPLTVQLHTVVRVIAAVAAGAGVMLGSASLALGLSTTESFLFGVGVAVALVPEGLLPTVTLSLARGAQVMASRNALVRRLDAVETLGETTFICTDKTGTLTENRMSVVEVVTPPAWIHVAGSGYEPVATFSGADDAAELAAPVAESALACVTGRVTRRGPAWVVDGDPMEAAIHCLAIRTGSAHPDGAGPVESRLRPYTADRMLTSCLRAGRVHVLGAPEAILARCTSGADDAVDELHRLTDRGLRVLGVARREWAGDVGEEMEADLRFLGLLALEDPPRVDVAQSLQTCRDAGIGIVMITGDHPRTARAIAEDVGLIGKGGLVCEGSSLPADDRELGALLDTGVGAVVARATPADKLRIAKALRGRGHVVAMTGDGVNDAPALREADVGVAMGASGSDVAREAADLVLLDDHFATIVSAVELGRATFQNVRRFLTFHLTDNVAELAPFALWALSGGSFPLAIGVLQVLALDIGTDMLPALALGTEPPRKDIMRGRRRRTVLDRALLLRAFLVLGATEALLSLTAFAWVLRGDGWSWGAEPSATTLAQASGTAIAVIAVCQMANAIACRSTTRAAWRLDPRGNPSVLVAIAAEVLLLVVFLGVPPVADLLGGAWPEPSGWAMALAAGAVLLAVDGLAKRRSPTRGTVTPSGGRRSPPLPQRAAVARDSRAGRSRGTTRLSRVLRAQSCGTGYGKSSVTPILSYCIFEASKPASQLPLDTSLHL
ncbi:MULTISPECIES: cation-translocating P-type ATPase [unclassified Nocardioides]|uniref:cation-translocating P-type ATPase n=1 Tax=unclassified Nocardioides TaxID=2615069 RepID=UPI00362421AA